jgi:hypothetical protein
MRATRVNRGNGALAIEQHSISWVIQRHVLREYGVVRAGPDPRTLIDPVSRDDLRQAVVALLGGCGPMLTDTSQLQQRGHQAYAVLTMCRVLYALQHGVAVLKPVAARWARKTLAARWVGLIGRALAWRKADAQEVTDGEVVETQAFVAHTLDSCQRSEAAGRLQSSSP